ncbi:hypothetical protein Sru01_15710 [Sphaerisporangium rufum]|uniref:Phosphoserine phosphatase n=1 Tax=Sphaerisporangium rufum TaxID=1381558 RepID=A0A919UY81_9ACTN|nr:HAD-IB family phosphatase [Sphaerisporangium rufum]GII76589.1 hypothetical protein Sru01_15710 [Sphaerisporangium rufum]
MSALHVFDMDGTLLASTAGLEISAALGCRAGVAELEREFAAGRLTTRRFAAGVHDLWRALTPEVVARAFRAGPWLDGIAEVCADIRARGEHAAVITLSPDFFAGLLRGFGFGHVAASAFPPPPMAGPVDPAGILTPECKVRITRALLAGHGLPAGRCVAYGDSRSDLPLFEALGGGVAVNADAALAARAFARYTGRDLRGAYALARARLDAAPVDAAPVDAAPVDAAPVDAAPVDGGALVDGAPVGGVSLEGVPLGGPWPG